MLILEIHLKEIILYYSNIYICIYLIYTHENYIYDIKTYKQIKWTVIPILLDLGLFFSYAFINLFKPLQ